MMHSLLLSLLLAQPFTSFGGSGAAGAGEAPRPSSIALYGDSLIEGACSGTNPGAALDALLPGGATQGYVVTNHGLAGETPHQIYARVVSATPGVGAATACLGGVCGHYLVQGAVNTLKNATYAESTPAAVASIALNGAGVCSVAVADSCGTLDSVEHLHAALPRARVLAFGVLPYAGCDVPTCGTLVAPGERAAAYNAALREACSARPWLTCIIPYADFEDPAAADHLLPAYACEDGIHLVNAGSAELAAQVYAAATW